MLAALANPATRDAFARVVLGLPLEGSVRVRTALLASGLVRSGEVDGDRGGGGNSDDSDALAVDETAIRAALAAGAVPRATGVERFLDVEGRIDRFPAGQADRDALLHWVVERTLAPAETVTERELTERLAAFASDPVALRRALVDAGTLVRTRSGSAYSRVGAPPSV